MSILKYLQNALKAAAKESKQTAAAEEKEKTAQTSEAEKRFKETLKDFDMPELPVYERMEYEDVDDEELKNRAGEKLQDFKSEGESKISQQYDKKASEADEKKTAAQRAFEQETAKLTSKLAGDSEDLNNKTIKAGLARSSIREASMDALKDRYRQSTAAAQGDLETQTAALDAQIEQLEEERRRAAESLDKDYEAALEAELTKLIKQRDSAKTAADKYNNTLTQREFNDRLKYAKAFEQLTGERKAELGNALGLTTEAYLSGMTRAEAYRQLTSDPAFKRYLSAEQYRRLLKLYS